MTKAIPYILVAILLVGIASLILLWTNKNDTKEQTDILKDQSKVQSDHSQVLIGLAKKLIGDTAPAPQPAEAKPEKKAEEQPTIPLTVEEETSIIRIADKLCFGKELDAEENALAAIFPKQIKAESERSKNTLNSLISKFLSGSGSKDFTQPEKDFYEDNQVDIDTMVQNGKLAASVISKIMAGNTDFSAEELQYQQNYPKQIEAELSRLKALAEKSKGSDPPSAADQRLKLILSFFEDGIPKTVTELSKLYASATKTTPSKGNASNIFGKLVEEGKLLCQKAGRGKPVYHGLPTWFENDKLKPEYQQKIEKA